MSTQFSAGPQGIGYLFQARYALLALLTDERPDAVLTIEGLDDLDIQGGNHIQLDQLKHHIKETASLTDYSVEVWKTIRVWSESLEQQLWKPEEVILNLITTANAASDSAAGYLRAGKGRNEEKAHSQLITIANTSTNATLLPAFQAFKKLRLNQQKRLIGAIVVSDGAANIQDTAQLIKRQLRFAVTEKETIDPLYERIEGWWFAKVVDHLAGGSKKPISLFELEEKIGSISEQFKRNSLPLDYLDEEPDELFYESVDNRIFVHQLKHIKVNTLRIRNAILDYYQAFYQRSRWVNDNLYIDEELGLYEKRLSREWSRYSATLLDTIEEVDSEENRLKFGKNMLLWMESQRFSIRSNMPIGHEYVCRGSYHILADKNPPSVYWHPRFLEVLETLLTTHE